MTIDEKLDFAIAAIQARIDGLTQQLTALAQQRNKLQKLATRVQSMPVDEREALLAVLDKIT